MRIPLIAGNWKMNKTASEAVGFVRELLQRRLASPSVELVIAPPFTAIESARTTLGTDVSIGLAGQNMHWEDKGAFTGEISAPMLKDLGCQSVILGHSERRTLFGETDEVIHRKMAAAVRHGLRPILCVGESLAERESGRTTDIITGQLKGCLSGFTAPQLASLTVAYEPVWAIGTGKVATPSQAQEVHLAIRKMLGEIGGAAVAAATRILYGGSVKPDNVDELMRQPDVDGALVGGASLDAESFARIIDFRN